MNKTNPVLLLKGRKVLRRSGNYDIYDHPELAGVLLKVRVGRSVRRHAFRRYSERRYGDLRQLNREANEFLAAMSRGADQLGRLAGFLGFSMTDLGPALMSEKLTDESGRLARTVAEEVQDLVHDTAGRNLLRKEVSELLDDLERAHIIVGDLSLSNIVRARERDFRLVVVDGLGERTLIPLTLFSRALFRQCMQRRRKRLLSEIDQLGAPSMQAGPLRSCLEP